MTALLALALVAGAEEPAPVVWIDDLHVVGHGPVWFADERAQIVGALARELRAAGVVVLDDAEVRPIEDGLAHRRLPWGDAACPVVPDLDATLGALHDGLHVLRPTVRCSPSACHLAVDVPLHPRERWTFDLSPGAGLGEVLSTLDAGPATRTDPGAGASGSGRLEGVLRPGFHVDVLRRTGAWTASPDTERLAARDGAFRRCVAKRAPDDAWWADLFVEVDAEGHTSHCEASSTSLGPAEIACVCDTLRASDLGDGGDQRRAEVVMGVRGVDSLDPRDTVRRAWLDELEASDPTALLAGVDDARLATCLAGFTAELPKTAWPVALDVGADGVVRRADLRALRGLDRGLVRCLDQALQGVRFVCPRTGAARITADLTLEVQPR